MVENGDAVVSEIGAIHPVMYDVCNLCEMVAENKLSSFKVKMLRVFVPTFKLDLKQGTQSVNS